LPKVVQLQDYHEKNSQLTEFAGFRLPLWFSGINAESLAVRNTAGIFDVSHMGRAVVRGKDSQNLLDKITTNDVASLKTCQGEYSLICNPEGGIKDDVLIFCLQDQEYLIVFNAGNREKDYDWIIRNSREFEVKVDNVSDSVAMFAVQGPRARRIVQSLSVDELLGIPRFGCAWTQIAGFKALVSRTGYTGEDGFEIFVWDSTKEDPLKAKTVWAQVLSAGKDHGLKPCGLGARDLLRLEAGLCLYGTDMDEKTDPYEAKLGFAVKLHKDFIGKQRLVEAKENGPSKVRVCLMTEKRVIPRHGFSLYDQGTRVGAITSGSLSPILSAGIAMGYVHAQAAKERAAFDIQIRDRMERARLVKPPFYDTTKYGYSRQV
jgi:aminomethyltransferase